MHDDNSVLVGGFNPSEKYESAGVTIPNTWKNKTYACSKPPTRVNNIVYIFAHTHTTFLYTHVLNTLYIYILLIMIYVYNLHTYIGTITLGGHHQTLGHIIYRVTVMGFRNQRWFH